MSMIEMIPPRNADDTTPTLLDTETILCARFIPIDHVVQVADSTGAMHLSGDGEKTWLALRKAAPGLVAAPSHNIIDLDALRLEDSPGLAESLSGCEVTWQGKAYASWDYYMILPSALHAAEVQNATTISAVVHGARNVSPYTYLGLRNTQDNRQHLLDAMDTAAAERKGFVAKYSPGERLRVAFNPASVVHTALNPVNNQMSSTFDVGGVPTHGWYWKIADTAMQDFMNASALHQGLVALGDGSHAARVRPSAVSAYEYASGRLKLYFGQGARVYELDEHAVEEGHAARVVIPALEAAGAVRQNLTR